MKLSDVQAAVDAVQDTLPAALTASGAGGFMDCSTLRTGLTAMLHHKAMDTYRSNASEARVHDRGADASAVAAMEPAFEADDCVHWREQKRGIEISNHIFA